MIAIHPAHKHRTAISLAVVCVYAVVLLSCVVCAADEHCSDPFCDEMDACHCTCALNVVVPGHLQFPAPNGSSPLIHSSADVLPLDAPRDLFRPPRSINS